jgi:hypothetical protein
MSALSIQVPFPVFQDRDGQPLENGYIWIGQPNLNPQTNPVVAYYDEALTIVAPQPLRTLNGYISRAGTPAQVYVDGVNFSILVQDSKGSMVYNFPDGTGISPNAAGVVYDPPFTGAVATNVEAKLAQTVSVLDFGADPTGVVDSSNEIQAALTASDGVYFPPGTYKITSTLNIKRGNRLYGDDFAVTTLQFWDCDGLKSAAGINVVSYENLDIVSVSGSGVPDPKSRVGIWSQGASGNINSWVTVRNCNLRGWATCISLDYTWNSCIDNTNTGFCTYGLVLFGQSVNNAITNSRLGANTGTASIYLQADGATIGEGLMVANSLLTQGAYGVTSNNGFLHLAVTNCIVDLITDIAFNLNDVRSACITGNWIYATNRGVKFIALGVSVYQNSNLTGNHILVTASSGIGVEVAGNNPGVTVTGNSFTNAGASSYSVYSDSDDCTVVSNMFNNGGSNPSVFFNASGCLALGVGGNRTVTYNTGVIGEVFARFKERRQGLTYGATVTPDASKGNYLNTIATNGSAFTIAAPLNPPADPQTQRLTIEISNNSGGALGTVTWDAIYKMASWTSPATGFRRSVTFQWNATVWVEIARTANDIPL